MLSTFSIYNNEFLVIKFYMVKLKMYNDYYWSLIYSKNDFKTRKPKEKFSCLSGLPSSSTDVVDSAESERVSLSRSKRNIKEICLCNDFQYFATITVSSANADRFSLQDCQDKMKKICHKIKRKNHDFKFIFITEKHKNGAFHFHGMVKNIDLYENSFGYLSSFDFDNLGYNSFSKINDYNKCCNYITKYITKSCCRNESNQIYFCSRGLKKCSDFYLYDFDLKSIFPKVYENTWVIKKDFDVSCLDRKTLLTLNDYFLKNDVLLSSQDNSFVTNLLQLLTNDKFSFKM